MTALIEVEKFGTIEVELYKDAAPITVDNFTKLVNKSAVADSMEFISL